jgi:hypothetical protein
MRTQLASRFHGAEVGSNYRRLAAQGLGYGVIGVFGTILRELEWKTPFFSWRVLPKTPSASCQAHASQLHYEAIRLYDVFEASGTALPEKICVFHPSSLKTVPKAPNASHLTHASPRTCPACRRPARPPAAPRLTGSIGLGRLLERS